MKKFYLAALCAGLLSLQDVKGATIDWVGGNTGNSMAAANNWSPATVPGAGDTAVFGTTANTNPSLQLGTLPSFSADTFLLDTATAYSFSIHVPSTFLGEGVNNTGGAAVSFFYQSTLTFNNSSSADYSNSGLVEYIAGNSFSPTTFNNSASAGSAQFQSSGGGTQVLIFNDTSSADNATISLAGLPGLTNTVTFNDSATMGNASIILLRGGSGQSNLIFNQSGNTTATGIITSTGNVYQTGSGTLTYTGNGSGLSGTTNLSAGNFVLNGTLGGGQMSKAAGHCREVEPKRVMALRS